MEKCHFWDIEKLLFLLSKKVSFLFRTLYKPYFMFFSDWKQIKKKIACFDQNYGLIPFRKMPFLRLWKFRFYSQKRFLFYLKLYLALFLVLFWPKTWSKTCDFWDYEKFCFYSPKSSLFLSRTLLTLTSSVIFSENK